MKLNIVIEIEDGTADADRLDMLNEAVDEIDDMLQRDEDRSRGTESFDGYTLWWRKE